MMGNASDFIIENGVLKKYAGPGGDVVIPEGVRRIDFWAFHGKVVTSLSMPVSMERISSFGLMLNHVQSFTVAEGNPNMKSIDGALYSADGKLLLQYPSARPGEFRIPQGVTAIETGALHHSMADTLVLPASLEEPPVFTSNSLRTITVDPENPRFRCMDGVLYDAAMETMLCYPAGKTGEYCLPDGVKRACIDSIANDPGGDYLLHMGADVSLDTTWGGLHKDNDNITIYAPAGGETERTARRSNCKFVPEGTPVALDDSHERKERKFQEWRKLFSFSARSKGVRISKYLRGSRVVYLPDRMGKAEIATIEKDAFPPETVMLCSKAIFRKLPPDNRHATIHAFLTERQLFREEEQEYLLDYLKKHRQTYLEKYILEEDYVALEACTVAMPRVRTLPEECLAITQRCGKQHMNLFLVQLSQK